MGIVINSNTGEIDVAASTPGTYRITYTTNGDCPNSSTQDITINALPTISISASSTSICAGDSVTLTASGAGAGGSYSWSDGQSTAAITVTPGATITYSVTGTDANGCFNTASQQITVTATDTATVQYAAASYCIMPTVPGAQNVNGYYPLYTTASAANAYSNDGQSHSHYLNAQTYYMPGASAGSTPGVVLFHGNYETSTDQPTVTGATGGTFSKHAGSGTLSINSSTGVIDLQASDAGTYTVRYTSTGTCPVNVDNTITIKPLDQTTFAYSGTSFPKVGTASVTSAPGTSGGTYSATPGLSINSSTGEIDLGASTIGTYKIFYQTAGSSNSCANNGIIENFGVTAANLTLLDNNAAMSFNGTDSYVDAGNSTELQITGDITVSAWFKSTYNGSGSVMIANKGYYGNGTISWQLYLRGSGGGVGFDYYGGNTVATRVYAQHTVAQNDGQWHHLVGVKSGSSSILYLDGAQVATGVGTQASIYNSSENVTIGASSNNASNFDGSIDEVAIFNKALSLSEVELIYNATNDNPGKTGDLFTGGLDSSLVYWNRMGDS